jgi:glutaredoxin
VDGKILLKLKKEADHEGIHVFTQHLSMASKNKNFFKINHVPFDYVDYDLQPETEQEKIMDKIQKSVTPGFPVVIVGDQVIVGYDPEKYSKTLD